MSKTCCFTGHRELPVGDKLEKLQNALELRISGLIRSAFYTFIAGGALGFDMLAACTVLRLKESHPQIKLKIALPCEGNSLLWRYDSRVVQNIILSNADEIILVSKKYFEGCMRKRNDFMAGVSDYCIAYLNKTGGGTFHTAGKAKSKGIEVFNLNELL